MAFVSPSNVQVPTKKSCFFSSGLGLGVCGGVWATDIALNNAKRMHTLEIFFIDSLPCIKNLLFGYRSNSAPA